MIGKAKVIRMMKDALAGSKADQAEAIFLGSDFGLTRYANSYIHQNIAQQNSHVWFKVAIGKQLGVASTNVFDKEGLDRALNNAIEIAMRAKPNTDFKKMASKAKYKTVRTYFEDTAKVTPAKRAAIVKKICNKASRQGLVASGALSTSNSEVAIVNTSGVAAYQPLTSTSVNIVISSDNSSGYAQGLSRRFDKIDFVALADKAVEKCLASRDPEAIEPGKYDVILEPTAVANLFEWLAFIGFGANPYHENTSFLSHKKGKKIVAPSLTIYDDGLDPKGVSFPFDFEGVPKKKVFFIRNGIAGGPVYDLLTANKYKTKSTGHGMTPGGSEGPIPLNVFIAAGKTPYSKMLESVNRGILVTRFHYINGLLDTPNAVLTGMTRDGTFLIENGKIASGIKNLRFTESMVRAFSNIQAISKETELVDTWWGDVGCVSAPALHIKDFTFSGKTEF